MNVDNHNDNALLFQHIEKVIKKPRLLCENCSISSSELGMTECSSVWGGGSRVWR